MPIAITHRRKFRRQPVCPGSVSVKFINSCLVSIFQSLDQHVVPLAIQGDEQMFPASVALLHANRSGRSRSRRCGGRFCLEQGFDLLRVHRKKHHDFIFDRQAFFGALLAIFLQSGFKEISGTNRDRLLAGKFSTWASTFGSIGPGVLPYLPRAISWRVGKSFSNGQT